MKVRPMRSANPTTNTADENNGYGKCGSRAAQNNIRAYSVSHESSATGTTASHFVRSSQNAAIPMYPAIKSNNNTGEFRHNFQSCHRNTTAISTGNKEN